MHDHIITVNHLSKSYGTQVAVNDLSFNVEAGSVFAFLGPNGAGKSTTIGCLTTLLSIDSGEVRIMGQTVGRDDESIRRSIGVVFQSSIQDPILTARENMLIRAQLYGVARPQKRLDELIDLIDLHEFIDNRYGALSGGQKRRVDIARALLHDPRILFLDEPTAGLDPKSRERVWNTVYELQRTAGLSVFLTTHYLEETEQADTVCVLDAGAIIANDTPTGLRARYSKDELRLTAKNDSGLRAQLDKAHIQYRIKHTVYVINTDSSAQALQILEKYKSFIADFEFRHGTMDDVFLKLTESSDRDGVN